MESLGLPNELSEKLSGRYPKEIFDHLLLVRIPTQQLFEFQEGKCTQIFPVSTSAKGAGNRLGSNQTPLGMHMVKEKHGAGIPLGGILVSREFTGEIVHISTEALPLEKDYITSRILWLAGLEEGKNKGGEVDSFRRYIYIHGTAEEGLIGKPASHGCVRMKNQDIIQVFERTAVGTHVLILDE